MVANLRRQHVLMERNLKEAFNFFDSKRRGYITLDDLRRVFGGICTEGPLRGMIDDVDLNHDGMVVDRCDGIDIV